MDQAAETDRLRRGRLGRVREQLKARDLASCVLLNPVNVRYATGARNMQVFHARNGVGMTREYPYILHAQDFASGYEGVIEPNMTLCVESYIGAGDGGEGVKLEEQVLVTESGVELLSRFPSMRRCLVARCEVSVAGTAAAAQKAQRDRGGEARACPTPA